MKCVICCRDGEAQWSLRHFETPPPLLRILNKPLIEYYLDFCAQAGIRDIRIVSDRPDGRVERYVADGSRWGLSISYGLIQDTDAVQAVLSKNRAFHANEPLLVIEGAVFLQYGEAPSDHVFLEPEVAPKCLGCDSGRLWCLKPDGVDTMSLGAVEAAAECDGLKLVSLSSIQAYYQLSMDLLSQPSHPYTLPGYGQKDRVFWGHHVEVSPYVTVKGPAMIGDEVQLKSRVSLGQSVVIGDHVLVDAGTTLEHAIIYGNSYVGQDLEFSRKIVWRDRLICPETGETTVLDDDVLVAHMEAPQWSGLLTRSVHVCLAAFLGILQTIPYCLLGTRTKGGRLTGPPRGLANRICWGLALDKYPHLWQVCRGRLRLVGHQRGWTGSAPSERASGLPHDPGLFSYAEMNGTEDDKTLREIDELYYAHHASLRLDLKVLFKSLAGRWISAVSCGDAGAGTH